MSDIIIQPRSRKPPRSAGVRPSGKAPAKISGIGVASSHFHGRLKSILHGDLNAANIIEMLEVGLPVTALMDLQAGLDVPVHIATEGMDLSVDLKRALSYARHGRKHGKKS